MIAVARPINYGDAYADYSERKEKSTFLGAFNMVGDYSHVLNKDELEGMWYEFKDDLMLAQRRNIKSKNNMVAIELSPSPEESKNWKEEDYLEWTKKYLQHMDDQRVPYHKKKNGSWILNPDGSKKTFFVPKTNLLNSKWFAMLHRDSKSGILHVHISVSMFDRDGNKNDVRLIGLRSVEAAKRVTNEIGISRQAMDIHADYLAETKDVVYDVLREMAEERKFDWAKFIKLMEKKSFTNYKGEVDHYKVETKENKANNVVVWWLLRGNTRLKASDIGAKLTAKKIAGEWLKIHNELLQNRDEETVAVKPAPPKPTAPKPANDDDILTPEEEEELYKTMLKIKEAYEREDNKPKKISQSELERESAIRSTKLLLNEFCQSVFSIFDRDEVFAIKKGIVAKCINDGGHCWNESDMKIAADSFFEDFDEKNRQEVRAKDLFTEIVDGLLPVIQASAGGGSNNNNLPKSKDDEWLWLHKNLFGMGPGRRR